MKLTGLCVDILPPDGADAEWNLFPVREVKNCVCVSFISTRAVVWRVGWRMASSV
jgi:hypothetical protein